MTTTNRMATLSTMIEQAIIPVFYHPDIEICRNVIQACSRAGAKCIEFTNRGDFAASVFLDLTRYFQQQDPSVILGVGSVVEAVTAGIYIANGARFVVGPMLDSSIAKVCNRRGVPYCPGCGSVSEIGLAQEVGCDLIKVFPGGSVGGPEFVRSVLGPMPWTRLMPTGGVEPSEESLRQWFGAGIVACGIGGKLITNELLASRDYAGLQHRVADALVLAKRIRTELSK